MSIGASIGGNREFDMPELGHAIVESSPMPMAAVEGETHLVRYVNPAFCVLAGKPGKELIGKVLFHCVSAPETLITVCDRVYSTGQAETDLGRKEAATEPMMSLPGANWSSVWSFIVWPISESGGRRTGVLLQAIETTSLHRLASNVKEALLVGALRQHEIAEAMETLNHKIEAEIRHGKYVEDELRRANNDLEEFACAVSHDLQEPLRTVMSLMQLLTLKLNTSLDSEAETFIEHIVGEVGKMRALIQDLLAYALAGAEEIQALDSAECRWALDEALACLNGLILETGATIVAGPLPRVNASARQLTEVFQNLIGNALKYRKPGCRPGVHIAAKQHGDEWIISVRDDGIGFDRQYAEEIFHIFRRLHSGEYEGTGIGLAICKRIVDRHRGRIWAVGEVNLGATFFFTLRGDTRLSADLAIAGNLQGAPDKALVTRGSKEC